MVFKNHIAYRFLTDTGLHMEMCEFTHPEDYKKLLHKKGTLEDRLTPQTEAFFHLVSANNNKTFYVTETVLRNLDAIKVSKSGSHYNWTVFKDLEFQKVTLILPQQRLLRIVVGNNTKGEKSIELFWCYFKPNKDPGSNIEGNMGWVMNFLTPETGYLCEHFDHPDTVEIEEFMYKLMCFFYLAENIEEIIPAGRSYGTRKTGKVLNEFAFPVTMVNSKWNVKSIRTEGFDVSGHFRLQPTNAGTKLIFIEPFTKNGYIRRAAKDSI